MIPAVVVLLLWGLVRVSAKAARLKLFVVYFDNCFRPDTSFWLNNGTVKITVCVYHQHPSMVILQRVDNLLAKGPWPLLVSHVENSTDLFWGWTLATHNTQDFASNFFIRNQRNNDYACVAEWCTFVYFSCVFSPCRVITKKVDREISGQFLSRKVN